MIYDGYGRLWKKHVPEQQIDSNNSSSTDHATFTYYTDDTVSSLTDARGATATYSYNGRHLLSGIGYAAPAGISAALSVSYGYDAAGNRISMTEKDSQLNVIGSNTYNYDQLSRLLTETRYFSALSSNPSTHGNYAINYQYNLAGELTSITDPFGAQISYDRDTAGRVKNVNGSGFLGIATYASNIQYRAWGGQKNVIYGDGTSATTTYNARMQPSSYQLPGLREQFQYYADGRLQRMTDLDDRNQDIGYPDTARHFSRAHSYDQAGRLVSATGSPSNFSSFPYNQSYGYDEFGNATFRGGFYYYQSFSSDGGTFQNNRRQDLNYDAAGNVTHTPNYNYVGGSIVSFRDWTYDGAGQMSQVKETVTANNSVSTYVSSHDGDGQPTLEYYQENPTYSKSYMVRSSVLGGRVLTRLDYAGNKWKTDFSVDGLLRVVQYGVSYYNQYATLQWTHIDPLGLSEAGDTKPVYDPMGNYIPWHQVPTAPPNSYPPIPSTLGALGAGFGSAQEKSCVFNGEPISCTELTHQIDLGTVAVDYLIMDSKGLRHWEGNVDLIAPGILRAEYPRQHAEGGDLTIGFLRLTIPQNPSQRPLTQAEKDKLSTDLKAMLAKPNCGTFISGVLGELGKLPNGVYSSDFMTIFNAIAAAPNGGLFSDPSIPPTEALAKAFGSLSGGNAQIAFGSFGLTAATAIHETMHDAAKNGYGYDHIQMAQAAYNSANAMGLTVLAKFPQAGDYKTWKEFDRASSGYFGQAVFDACVRDKPWQPPPRPQRP